MKNSAAMRGDRGPQVLIAVLASSGMAIMLFILFFLLREGIPLLRSVSLLDVLGGRFWYPTYEPPEFGMLPLVVGSLTVTLLASLMAVPVSLGAAIFLSEICPRVFREFFKP